MTDTLHLMQPAEAMQHVAARVAHDHGLTVDELLARSRKAQLIAVKREAAQRMAALGINKSKIARFMKRDPSSINRLVNS